MKIAVSGKGGVGKTTFSAMLAGTLALQGGTVIAIDADPDANLASAFGVSPDDPLTPIAEMRELIAERTGAKDNYGGYFKLNPKVDDIPEKFARKIGNIHLLALGGVAKGGSGCICPASALVKALLTHLVLGREDSVIMDMEAGIEHLGRATARSMDCLIVVVDPGPWSRQTALKVRSLAADIGMKNVFAFANRVENEKQLEAIKESLDGIPLVGRLGYDPRLVDGVAKAAPDGSLEPAQALVDGLPIMRAVISEIRSRL